MTETVGTLCLYYPQQERIINFEKIAAGIRIEIKSGKRTLEYVVIDGKQKQQLKEWLG